MLVTMKEMLDDARARHYGVGFFNTFSVEMAQGVIEAAEELNAPVMIGTADALKQCFDIPAAGQMLKYLSERSRVPVAVHLDHGYSEEVLHEAMDNGFTSIMYDLSEVPYEENIRRSRAICEEAHGRGISVECELGHVVFDTKEDTGYAYTRPEEVLDFVGRTGVDALAIAIGTAHGPYKVKPVLDLARLREIRELTEVALVLHGGSGLSDEDFRNCVRDGIQKINIYTDISYAASDAARDWVEKHSRRIEEVSVAMREAVKAASLKKLRLFGCEGKA